MRKIYLNIGEQDMETELKELNDEELKMEIESSLSFLENYCYNDDKKEGDKDAKKTKQNERDFAVWND